MQVCEVGFTMAAADAEWRRIRGTMPRIWNETGTAKIDLVENRYEGGGPKYLFALKNCVKFYYFLSLLTSPVLGFFN